MNSTLQKFARNYIKEALAQLPVTHSSLFKRMYSHKDLELPINTVVDRIPEQKLDWAMEQVRRSLEKL